MTETRQSKQGAESAAEERSSELGAHASSANAATKAQAGDTSPMPHAPQDDANGSEDAREADARKALDSLSSDTAASDGPNAEKDAEAALASLGDPVRIPESADSARKLTAGLPKQTIAIVAAVLVVLGLIAWALVATSAVHPDNGSREQQDIVDARRSSDGMAIEAVATELLDQMKDQDPTFVSSLATHMDSGFSALTGYRHTDLGIDPSMLALWMLTDFDYQIDGVYVEGNSGTVYATITVRDALTMVNSLYDKAYDYFNSSEAIGLNEEAAKARMGQLYQEALAEPVEMRSLNATFEFEKHDGDWTVRQDSLSTELSLMFGVYDQGTGNDAKAANSPESISEHDPDPVREGA